MAPTKEHAMNKLPSYHQRAFAHNYHAPFIYHIIIKKQPSCETFGELRGNALIRYGNRGCAYIKESELGKIVARAIMGIQKEFPILQVYQFKIMPDHAHFILHVKEWSEKPLDSYVEKIKHNVASRFSEIAGRPLSSMEIFEAGFCDKPLLRKRSLDTLYTYLRENPHRLAMRRQFPQFFQTARHLNLLGHQLQGYGNFFLLRNPDKHAVKVSRTFSAEEKKNKIAKWLDNAGRGSVLVSPFISREEKSIRDKAEKLSAKIILITHEAFGERYKPAAHDFELCGQGRLLILSLGLPIKTPISRNLCNQMNNLALEIAEN